MGYKTKYDGVSGVGSSSLSRENIERNEQGIFYGGLHITNEVKEQLEEQEIGLFVQFDKQEDNSYIMRPQIPETGMHEDGQTYSIRKNINLMLKNISSQFVDKDGGVDLEKANKITDYLCNLTKENEIKDAFKYVVDYDSLSKNDKKDFDSFMNIDDEKLWNIYDQIILGFNDNINSLVIYNKNLYRSDLDDNKKELLKDSEHDFEQFLDDLRRMAKMDPNTEKNVYIPGDCSTSGRMNNHFYGDVLRAKKGNNYVPRQIKCNETLELCSDSEEGNFMYHVVSSFNTKIGTKDAVITLETTAPPGAKLVFHPERSYGGVGVYESHEKLKEMHLADNKRPFGDVSSKEAMVRYAMKEGSYCPSVYDSSALAANMKGNKKLIKQNSKEYNVVKDVIKEIADIEKQMKDDPSKAGEYRDDLRRKCGELIEASQKYLDSRNPVSANGKRRYEMVEKANRHAVQLSNRMDRLYAGKLTFHKDNKVNKKAVNMNALMENEGMTRKRSNAVTKQPISVPANTNEIKRDGIGKK